MSATETRPPAAVPCLRRVRPFQPTTASPHVLDVVPERFHTQGSELIVKFVLEMLEKVGQEMVGDLKANLLWGGTRRVGTLCSGTDSPMIGYGAVQQAMNTLGCNWSFAHVFACDKSPTSQRFIKTLWKDSLTHLFVECGEVASATVGRDLLSASGVSDIPAVDDVIAGFPCQDVSSLRRSKQLNASVVKDGEKRTGDMNDMCYVTMVRCGRVSVTRLLWSESELSRTAPERKREQNLSLAETRGESEPALPRRQSLP